MVVKLLRRRAARAPESLTQRDQDIAAFLCLKKDALKKVCELRGIAVSGTKQELAARLADFTPTIKQDERPTEKQLKFLAELERQKGVTAEAGAFVSRAVASRAIDYLKGL